MRALRTVTASRILQDAPNTLLDMKKLAVMVLATMVLAAFSSPALANAHQAEAPIDVVPCSHVGAGWMLAMWSPAQPTRGGDEPAPGAPTYQNSPTTLYLVSPEGDRYAITTFAAPGDDGSTPFLVDWSGDGNRALFYDGRDKDRTVIEVNLHTGAQTSFTVKDGFNTTPRYSRPEGKAVLLAKSRDVDGPPSLVRVDLAGNHQLTYPIEQYGDKLDPRFLSTADGTQLVLGTDSGGLAVMGNNGTAIRTLPVLAQGSCTPTRWWDADSTVVVANCNGGDYAQSQLWSVPVDGGKPTPLTQPLDGKSGEILGVGSAWKLPSGTFLQAYGACGYSFLAKLDNVGGTAAKVSVPNVENHHSVDVIGAYDGHLDLHATLSCGSGESLIDYDPVAGTSTVLLGPGVNGGGVDKALPYPGFE
jgi:TolB protein